MTAADTDPPAVATRRLRFTAPYDTAAMLGWLGARAVTGVEVVDDSSYARSLRLPGGYGTAVLRFGRGHVRADVQAARASDLDGALASCRTLLDLDVDPAAVDTVLRRDPLIAPLVAAAPGLRLPGSADPAELAIRAVLGQQVTLAAARTLATRLVVMAGAPLAYGRSGTTHAFPTPPRILEADLSGLGMPGSRQTALRELCRRLVDGTLSFDGDGEHVHAQLLEIPGIGPWTAGYVRLRGLHDPDVFLPGDVALRRAAAGLGLPATEAGLRQHAERWRPWRSYAMQHLWYSVA